MNLSINNTHESDSKINETHIKQIMSQTNYSEEVARNKLIEYNYDFMRVLKNYMGIPEKKEINTIKSINQEIYKQIRSNLDQTMKEYREKNPVNIDQVVANLQESDERENDKCKK
jgi:hypothetical protein